MIFSKRDIQKRQRNGEIIASNTKISNSSSNIGSSGISGNYLPANSSDTGYEVPHYVSFTETIDEVTKSLLDITTNGITVGGNTLSKGDVVAYFTGESDLVLPIASENALGCIKVGDNLYISEDGTLNASASGGGGEWGTITGTLTDQTDLVEALDNKLDKTDENLQLVITNTHNHTNKDVLDTITSSDWDKVKDFGDWFYKDDNGYVHSRYSFVGDYDVSAYGSGDSSSPTVVYDGLDSTATDVALSANQGRILKSLIDNISIEDMSGYYNSELIDLLLLGYSPTTHTHTFSSITSKPTTLLGYGITDAASSSDLNNHISNTTLHITSNERSLWNTAYNQSHTHSNKSVIDNITTSLVNSWNTAYNNNHTHSNKSVIDNITTSLVNSWNTAYNQSHNHSNKSYLDVINLSLSKSSSATFAKVTSTGDVVAYSQGSSTAPFKYWRPTVSSSGVISWTDSSSEVTPDSVNIKGSDGVGISSIRQTTSSTSSGGRNVWTATLTNGSTSTFTVYNGAAGADGADGADGESSGWPTGQYFKDSLLLIVNNGHAGLLFWNQVNYTGVKVGGGNGVTGYSGSASTIGNLYLNYISSTTNVLINNAGKITYNSVGTWSDMRLKNKIESLDNVIDKIKDLDIFYFNWKDDTEKEHIGLSAQLLQEIFPDLVSETDTSDQDPESVAYLTVDYPKLSAIAIQAVKELNAKIDKQDEVINELKEEINKLWNLLQVT